MARFRIPIWTLMVAVFLVAVGFAALRHASDFVASGVFSLTVVLLGIAVVVGMATNGRKRLAWLSSAVSGTIYLAFAFGPIFPSNGVRPPLFLPTTLMTTGLRHLDSQSPTPLVATNTFGPAPSVSYIINPTPLGTYLPDPTTNSQNISTFTDYISINYQNSFATGVANREPFYQVGHSLATLLIGFLAAIVTLVVTGFKRYEVP